MGTVHDLLETHGRQALIAEGRFPRDVIEAAARVLDEGYGDVLAFAYAGWAQCALPHQRLPPGTIWTVDSPAMRLEVVPGRRLSPDGRGPTEPVSVPFGSYARLILLWLQIEALRTGRREIERGTSWRAWLEQIGLSWGGGTGRAVREQADLLARCSLTFYVIEDGRAGLVNRHIVDKALFLDGSSRHDGLVLDTATLSESFFAQIRRHPIPLDYAAVRALATKSQALDCYMFLAYRLPRLSAPRLVPWDTLKAQFGVRCARCGISGHRSGDRWNWPLRSTARHGKMKPPAASCSAPRVHRSPRSAPASVPDRSGGFGVPGYAPVRGAEAGAEIQAQVRANRLEPPVDVTLDRSLRRIAGLGKARNGTAPESYSQKADTRCTSIAAHCGECSLKQVGVDAIDTAPRRELSSCC